MHAKHKEEIAELHARYKVEITEAVTDATRNILDQLQPFLNTLSVSQNTTNVVSSEGSNAENDLEKSKPRNDFVENKSDQKDKPAATNFSVDTGNFKA
ncbi:hypothetical protein CFP56_004234 [Quercus suber]|uniref:Uncharacterized protein n=1 Tax=Quercus suber TaxID=58331 RepID=A0AAW0LBJ5_QUESU